MTATDRQESPRACFAIPLSRASFQEEEKERH